jgi:hypothetical protein
MCRAGDPDAGATGKRPTGAQEEWRCRRREASRAGEDGIAVGEKAPQIKLKE